MNQKETFTLAVSSVLITLVLTILFLPAFEYQNQCLVPPCGITTRALFEHLVDRIPIHNINIPVLIAGILLSYAISLGVVLGIRSLVVLGIRSLVVLGIRKMKKSKGF